MVEISTIVPFLTARFADFHSSISYLISFLFDYK